MSRIKGIQASSQGIFASNKNSLQRQNQDKGGKKQGTSIYAGNLNMGQDSILARKKRAQRQAMKMITDVFKSDLKTDEEQKNRQQHIEELKKENADARAQLKDIEDMQNNLMEEYGVTKDSQEQKDLEIIRKVMNATDPAARKNLSEEEVTRYAQIQEAGFTDYQKKALALDEDAKDITARIADNKKSIGREEEEYKDTKMQLLKKSPMVGAKKQAEELLEAARKEMIGALYNESKEYIDEKAEKAKEEQKEKKEQKAEEEKKEALQEVKKLEKEMLLEMAKENSQSRAVSLTAKEKARNQSALQDQMNEAAVSDIYKDVTQSTELDQEMKDLLEKMRLLQEDLKGAAVDDKV